MEQILWRLPHPSTELLGGGARFEKGPGRLTSLGLEYEADDGVAQHKLTIEGVEALKVTYYRAMSAAALKAYDKLIDVGDSPWLEEIRKNLAAHEAPFDGLKHLVITFDDGPSYEFICKTFRFE